MLQRQARVRVRQRIQTNRKSNKENKLLETKVRKQRSQILSQNQDLPWLWPEGEETVWAILSLVDQIARGALYPARWDKYFI